MKYSRVLLSNCPSTTTELFIEYYKGEYVPRTQQVEPLHEPEAQQNNPLQNLAAFLPLPLLNAGATARAEPAAQPVLEEREQPIIDYQIPKPRTAFSAFVGHPQEFITFLEALVSKEGFKKEDKIDLYTTLFEMYLNAARRQKRYNGEGTVAEQSKKVDRGQRCKDSRS